jgi:hypothetical protein
MFKPFRLLILLMVAFVAGLLFERHKVSEKCTEVGGRMDSGLCRGAL